MEREQLNEKSETVRDMSMQQTRGNRQLAHIGPVIDSGAGSGHSRVRRDGGDEGPPDDDDEDSDAGMP